MGSGPGSPFGLEDKAHWTFWMFNFGGFTDSPHPHKQETRGLDRILATSFFPWWLLLFFQESFQGICIVVKKKILKSGKIPEKSQAWFYNDKPSAPAKFGKCVISRSSLGDDVPFPFRWLAIRESNCNVLSCSMGFSDGMGVGMLPLWWTAWGWAGFL